MEIPVYLFLGLLDSGKTTATAVTHKLGGIELDPGKHTVEFRYKNQAFELGRTIFLCCLALLLVITAAVYGPKLFKRLKGKYLK